MKSNNRIFQRKMLFVLIIVLAFLLVSLLIGVWLLGRDSDTPVISGGPPGGTTGTEQTQVSTNPEQSDSNENTPEGTVPSTPTDQTLPSTAPDTDKPQTQDQPSDNTPPPKNDPPSKTDSPTKTDPPVQKDPPTEEIQLEVERIARFSGQFVEDGSDDFVDHVVAILVKNPSDRFLDLGTVVYEIDGKTATFVVTGLPAGRSAWVMEQNAMTVDKSIDPKYMGCKTSYRDGVTASTNLITVQSDGSVLTVTNNTNRTLENVFVYYKTLHTDGSYFGGITYVVEFGTLEPGGSAQNTAGHYQQGSTEIVRIGWQESQS